MTKDEIKELGWEELLKRAVTEPGKAERNPPMEIRILNNSDIGKCKFFIFQPDHYREDGSCKCDDHEHRAMMIREWGYSKADFENVPLRGASQ